jgi:hypothetical protein
MLSTLWRLKQRSIACGANNQRSRMKKSTKAALWSGLLFPGAGHFFLKRYRRGFLLLSITLAALVIIIRDALDQALAIADKIQSGAIPLDAQIISQSIEEAANTAASLPVNVAWLITIVCWVIALIDAFRIGRQEEAKGQGPQP